MNFELVYYHHKKLIFYKNYLDLDHLQAQNISDRIWTEQEGHRTPYGSFGELPDADEDDDEDEDDDIELGGSDAQ